MRHLFHTVLSMALAWVAAPSFALEPDAFISNTASFNNIGTLNVSTLASVVANNALTWQVPQMGEAAGNRIENIGNGGFGVISVIQNNAPGAVVQQSVTVTIGSMVLPAAEVQ